MPTIASILENWAGAILVIGGAVMVQLGVQMVISRLLFAQFNGEGDGRLAQGSINILSLVTVFTLIFGHVVQVLIWALLYAALAEFKTFSDAAYFSLASFTTVGAAELELSRSHRVLGALEAGVGVLMFGWSTAILVELIGLTKIAAWRKNGS